MRIKIKKDLELTTYSQDLICIKKGNKTIVSYVSIMGALKWLDKNGYKGIKNRVQEVLIDFSNIDIKKFPNNFKTSNYNISFDEKREYTVADIKHRNNVRFNNYKNKVIEKVYFLEINKLEVTSIELLIHEIKILNKFFNSLYCIN